MPGVRFKTLRVGGRADGSILKVVLTIADLEAAESVEAKRCSEAIQYRTLAVLGVATNLG
jgi:predicted ATPase with chaperone activity